MSASLEEKGDQVHLLYNSFLMLLGEDEIEDLSQM